MEAISLVALVALMQKIVDTFKYITNKNINAFVTQFTAWLVGIVTVWLSTKADITENIEIFGQSFGSLNFGSIVLGGMIFSSAASVVYDLKTSRDNTDSAKMPPLLPD